MSKHKKWHEMTNDEKTPMREAAQEEVQALSSVGKWVPRGYSGFRMGGCYRLKPKPKAWGWMTDEERSLPYLALADGTGIQEFVFGEWRDPLKSFNNFEENMIYRVTPKPKRKTWSEMTAKEKHEICKARNSGHSDAQRLGKGSKWVNLRIEDCFFGTACYRVKPKPKTWGELSDREKGALLLAHHRGADIEFTVAGRWTGGHPCWVDGVSYRIKPKPALTPITLDWSALDAKYKWAAKDNDGRVSAHENRPSMGWGGGFWDVADDGGGFAEISGVLSSLDAGTVDWKDSLIERPS